MMIKIKHLPFALLTGSLCFNAQASDPVVTEQNMIYTSEQMLNFNVSDYLRTYAPHLLPYAETISHWAGTTTISPKVLIALMEKQSSIISLESTEAMSRPFGELSDKEGFNEQLMDVSQQLMKLHYEQANNPGKKISVEMLLSSRFSATASQEEVQDRISGISEKFSNNYFLMFPDEVSGGAATGAQATTSTTSDSNKASVPPANLLQLPYPVGNRWQFSGAHANDGLGSIYSSMDFGIPSNWGDDNTNMWVVAAADGVVKVHSSCHVEVIHEGGWSTSYYHVDNIQYSDGDTITRDANLAQVAYKKEQALCSGGDSSGPHLHFSLKQGGSYFSLQDVKMSGYKVHIGTSNYDQDCTRFYLLGEYGRKVCTGYFINPGVPYTYQTVAPSQLPQLPGFNSYSYSFSDDNSGPKYDYKEDIKPNSSSYSYSYSNSSNGSNTGSGAVGSSSNSTSQSYSDETTGPQSDTKSDVKKNSSSYSYSYSSADSGSNPAAVAVPEYNSFTAVNPAPVAIPNSNFSSYSSSYTDGNSKPGYNYSSDNKPNSRSYSYSYSYSDGGNESQFDF